MHIEPGIVEGSKILLSYGTAVAALAFTAKLSFDTVKRDGAASLLLRSVLTTLLVFSFFEILPHHPVGVSEVHLILGTTLLLIFGLAPAAIGLAVGLLLQGSLFAPTARSAAPCSSWPCGPAARCCPRCRSAHAGPWRWPSC